MQTEKELLAIRQKLIDYFGSLKKAGDALDGIRGEAIGKYFKTGQVPAERARQLVDMAPKVFSLNELRPDLWRDDELIVKFKRIKRKKKKK